MKKILLVNIDSKFPNLALKKIEKYHLDKGDIVVWDLYLARYSCDKIYVSCIFDWNRYRCSTWEGYAEIGGSGYDIEKKLPPEIEKVLPRINMGFTTRGCIRNCGFCIVPKKEGHIHIVGDLLDLWDGKSKDIVVMDNNILGMPDHFELICKQSKENKIRIDFNQGLDHRLLTPEIIGLMKSIPHKEYRFAFDHPSLMPSVEKALNLLQKNKINRAQWYVLVQYNTTFEQDMERLNYLRSRGQRVYVQRYEFSSKNPKFMALARWANQHHIFYAMSWEEFCRLSVNTGYDKFI